METKRSSRQAIFDYQERMTSALGGFDYGQIESFVAKIFDIRKQESTVFVAGNGGSASTASHYAVDWMLGTALVNPSLRVIALTESAGSITATGNDQGFDRIFQRQLEHLGRARDLLVVVSASGNSSNLVALVRFAQSVGIVVVAITGFDGGVLKQLADFSVHVETAAGDYGIAEDLHLMIGHVVKEALIAGAVNA